MADECTEAALNGHEQTNGAANGNTSLWWSNGDQSLSWVDAGKAGVWAITPDMSVCFVISHSFGDCDFKVLYREGTGHGQLGPGTSWTGGLGKMRNISVGSQVSPMSPQC